ncbi:thioredoxin fold domain-containing protein [Hydrogenophaga sp. YM1]|uniref:thioredoxin fold domain-containing protein n=1 Tax=Hydrogenophaga TaxID=47420 RepID=UPI00086F5CD7|nr:MULTISPECIES: thioredoxin fold domain-containing protein [unclassified Hydrogenophaga]MBN9372516.1 thioredoxin fold domain-containing protein [Hydrogenophaga sp.]ODT33699.1 MAG: thiol:disulfide interchange protein [Hydrogenophaga sp. SCN 70-13]OJV61434.1 MAG: thiol:disulfide interchange protein [Hydrogenophaga sp. 70-12]QRR35760.1 thioredoxin fold domain-containing protein [Hydrogenophaga sp. YM1]
MKRRHALLSSMAAFAAMGFLSACSREPDAAPPAPPIDHSQALQVLAAEGKGFTVGAMMAAQTVYVLFDPQCPHCAALWESSQPLLRQARFVWLPVALLNAKSLPQGAAILGAANPAEAMATHEKSLSTGQGGISASASVPAELEAAIKHNTALLTRLGAESVPFIVARDPKGNGARTVAGAMPTGQLASFIGLGGQ